MRVVLAAAAVVFFGKSAAAEGHELFAAKGCVACHHPERDQSKYGLGPSLKMIAAAYDNDAAGLVSFLAADPAAKPRVLPDKYPLMKTQQAVSKTWTDAERAAVATFLLGHR